MKLLLGTTNPAKQAELDQVFQTLAGRHALALELVTPASAGIDGDVEETGATFEENSRNKARTYQERSGLPTVSDDGGLEIQALGGEPGVHSRRWPGHAASDEELIAYCLARLADHPELRERGAQLRTCLTFSAPGEEDQACAAIAGHIALTPAASYTRGYPYRALFVVDAFGKLYDELTPAEHAAVNHRAKAAAELFERTILPFAYA